jgi:hypothetical protein
MMNMANRQLGVNEIKTRAIFYGCDWKNLRYIAPLFVPALASLTDTAYFPTNKLGNLPDQRGGRAGWIRQRPRIPWVSRIRIKSLVVA